MFLEKKTAMNEKIEFLYTYDALCGWCYGFSPVIKKLYETFGDRILFQALSGGMVTGDRVQPMSELMAYIGDAYKVVEQHTGVKFGQRFLEEVLPSETILSDSLPPGVALTVFRKLRPQQVILFAHDLQHALYRDGADLNADTTYAKLATVYELDAAQFLASMKLQENIDATWEEFSLVNNLGVNGFPTTLIRLPGEPLQVLTRGYAEYDPLHNVLTDLLDQIKTK